MNEYITSLKVTAFGDLNVTMIEFYTLDVIDNEAVETLINRLYVPTTLIKNFFILKKKSYETKEEKRKEERSIFS